MSHMRVILLEKIKFWRMISSSCPSYTGKLSIQGKELIISFIVHRKHTWRSWIFMIAGFQNSDKAASKLVSAECCLFVDWQLVGVAPFYWKKKSIENGATICWMWSNGRKGDSMEWGKGTAELYSQTHFGTHTKSTIFGKDNYFCLTWVFSRSGKVGCRKILVETYSFSCLFVYRADFSHPFFDSWEMLFLNQKAKSSSENSIKWFNGVNDFYFSCGLIFWVKAKPPCESHLFLLIKINV